MANRFLLSARILRAGFAATLLGVAMALPSPAPAAGGHASAAAESPSIKAAREPGVVRTEIPVLAPALDGTRARRPHRVPPPLEEVYVFQDSLDGRSIEDEAGWTHFDNSERPVAWHIDSLLACQGKAWWCGRIDSSWVYDSNRMGYENSWSHYLESGAWLDSIPNNAVTRIRFRHRFKAETDYDIGQVQVYDWDEGWLPIATFTGDVHGPGGALNCDTATVVIPEDVRAKWYLNSDPAAHGLFLFRFAFLSDIAYSSADGLYDGDGWIIDNITLTVGNQVRFFDNCENGPAKWTPSIFPAVGDYYQVSNNVVTEDICTDNRTNVWVMWDPVVQSLVPRLDDLLRTPPVDINRSSEVFVAFDVYRNLPLFACFYYHLRYRTKNIGDPDWSEWIDPTRLLYYGASKDWVRQKVQLTGATNKDSLMVELGVTDYGQIYCEGSNSSAGVYTFFDNVAVGVVVTAPPTFVSRDVDLFNDTFSTLPFGTNDNINTALGDSAVVEVNASRGYKSGFMYWRRNGGSFSAVPLLSSTPALPRLRYADVPAAAYPANSTIEYYFGVTDSTDATSYLPAGAITDQQYFSASVLPLKTATNPGGGCIDSLASILFVNNNAGRETKTYIAESLKSWGYKFDTWDVNAPSSGIGNTPGGETPGQPVFSWPPTDVSKMIQYSTIIWHSGSMNSFTLRPQDQALLQSWIQQSGKNRNLWITGDNIADDLITRQQDYNTFLSYTCGVTFLRDLWESSPQDSLLPTVNGVAGGPAAGRQMHADAGCPQIDDFDLVLTSSQATANGKAGPLLRYPTGYPAATRYATKYVSFGSDSARVAFMGFSFNSIKEGGERLLLTRDIMNTYFKATACYSPTAVEEDPVGEAPPIPNSLAQNVPNPFNPSTTIRYSVSKTGPVAIRVYNAGGALVRTLVSTPHAPGAYSVRWDGTDDGGRHLASGVYFYRIESAGFRDAKKLILLK